MDEDQIIAQRLVGKSVRAIAKAAHVSAAEINAVIDAWAESVIDDKLRKNSLALELARLDELQQVFYRRALEGDTNCGLLVCKLIERRGVRLGLAVPQTQLIQIVDSTQKQTSTQRIEQAINELIAQDRAKDDDPTTH